MPPTPLLKKGGIFFKREDLNPSGSVKDRAIVFQLKKVKEEGKKRVALSSSGNAAISLGFWAKKFGLKATVFVSPKINPNKLSFLQTLPLEIKITPRPISQCFRFCRQEKAVNLRQSTDPNAWRGFSFLGKELKNQLAQRGVFQGAVFFPVSSGATLRGVCQQLTGPGWRFFIVQPASHPPLASLFDREYQPEKKHWCDALVARVIPFREEIIALVKKSGGGGVVVQNREIIRASSWLEKKGIKTSFEGAATLAAVWKLKEKGVLKNENLICLLTGKKYG